MQQYKTQKGNTLQVVEREGEIPRCKTYEFILREKKPAGEHITLLMLAEMATPDYFISKFIREY